MRVAVQIYGPRRDRLGQAAQCYANPYAVRSPVAGLRPIAAATEPIMPSDPLSGRE